MSSARGSNVRSVADAVLYEGYALYPYRASSMKNQLRWTFGGVYPAAYARSQSGSDRQRVFAEVVHVGELTGLHVTLRFLRVVTTERGWQEGEPCEVEVTGEGRHGFSLAAAEGRAALDGAIVVERRGPQQLRVTVENLSAEPATERERAIPSSLGAAHLLLRAEGGTWVSLRDPPPPLRELVERCEQGGLWPVLAGADVMLAAPIILPDYPETAAASPGDMFDGTEIDEILTLRVLTLTDAEKAEMRATDPRTRAILERAEALDASALRALHGLVLPRQPQVGDRVRIQPRRTADALDLVLAGKTGTVRKVEVDFEDGVWLCVTLDDDPGEDLGIAGWPGHRFFYAANEVELLS